MYNIHIIAWTDISKFKRNHCLITLNFQKEDILNFLEFIKKIKNFNFLFIESIYSENPNYLIYTSQYYKTHTIHKSTGKIFKKSEKDYIYNDYELKIRNLLIKDKSKI